MSAATVASSGDDRPCPSCSDGRVLSFDLHTRCEVCLGAQHAGLALTPRSSCPYCTLLPPAEKQRRVDFFTADDVWPLRETYSVEEALEVLDPLDVSDLDVSSHAGSSVAPLFQPEELEHAEGGCAIPGEPGMGIPGSLPSTTLPSIGGLVKELPDVIRHAATRRDLPFPPAQEAATADDVQRFYPRSAEQARRCMAPLPAHPEVPRGRCGGSEGP
ncbi:Hypothetical protein SMAX5B_017132 [Scomber scombrus]|uniref:Uncharacterized protein n=1 Tax=Scomber scombrus TaxID=13677 RepID=A0AAV1QKT7_SCOSC